MARSIHPTYTAVDRYKRRATRRQRPVVRRESTRKQAVMASIRQENDR